METTQVNGPVWKKDSGNKEKQMAEKQRKYIGKKKLEKSSSDCRGWGQTV